MQYEVVLPNGYDPAKTYPAVLAFPPGGQDWSVVKTTVDHVWRAPAEARGYIVVEPAAPRGTLFFEGGDFIFPQFITMLLGDYHVAGNKFHIAGMSNGGLSAFLIASKYPQYAWSVTGFPGFLENGNNLDAFAHMCVHMFAGSEDSGWPQAMQAEAAQLRAKGIPVTFSLEKGQPHVIATLQGQGANRLFDQFDTARTGHCAQ